MKHTSPIHRDQPRDLSYDHVRSRLVTLVLSLGLYCCLSVSHAWAEKPEIMLLIDASSSMQRLQHHEAYPTGCSWARNGVDPQPAGAAVGQGFSQAGGEQRDLENLTRLHWAQWHLAGSIDGPLKCVGHDHNERSANHAMGRDGFIAHYRLMCSPQNNRGSFNPCGEDHGRRRRNMDPDGVGLNNFKIQEDGFIRQAGSNVLFGMMVSDSDPQRITQGNGFNQQDWSYGASMIVREPPAAQNPQGNGQGNNVGNTNVLALLSQRDLFGDKVFTSPARDPRSAWLPNSDGDVSFYLDGFNNNEINLGVRGESAPQGYLIHPHKGQAQNPGVVVNHADHASISAHNNWVRQEMRAIVPHGPSPLSAMLSDLKEYYKDRDVSCEPRIALLITDGAESTYLPSRACTQDQQCEARGLRGVCVDAPQTSRISHEQLALGVCDNRANNQWRNNNANNNVNNNNVNLGNNLCKKVCAYPEGAPYQSAVDIARELHDEHGVSVVVALVGHSSLASINYDIDQMSPAAVYAYQIAKAGAPKLGPAGNLPGLYNVESLPSAVDLINRVKAANNILIRSETQPQVLAIGLGDAYVGQEPDPALRQIRTSAYGFTPAQDTRRYSKVEAKQMGCRGIQVAAKGLKELGEIDYEDKLKRQTKRPVFTIHPRTREVVSVVDANNALFDQAGKARGNTYKSFIGNCSSDKAQSIGRQMLGYFGQRGIQNNATHDRTYGGITQGDLVALPPTGSGRTNLGDPDFFRAQRQRPNLIFFSGDDGLVHAVRAFDGHNLFSFAPLTTWREISSNLQVPVDGPMTAGEVIPCRGAGGAGACSSGIDANVRSMVVGGVGEVGREIFGFEVSGFTPNQLRDRQPSLESWPRDAKMWSLTEIDEADLGLAVSRPTLAHVRVNNNVKGVVIAGCGNDPNSVRRYTKKFGAVGRCLLIIDAEKGEVLYKITGENSDNGLHFPVVGSPTVYPNGGPAAEQIYFGDIAGQMFRLDLNNADPQQWKLTRVWPLKNPAGDQADFLRGIGHAVLERPSLAIDTNNDRIIVFATSAPKVGELPGHDVSPVGHMVSLRERRFFDAQGRPQIETLANWVLDFALDEFATGAPRIRNSTAFVTTSRPSQAQAVCGGSGREGRLYGVHATKVLSNSYRDNIANRDLRVIPMLPRYNRRGERDANALSLVLPPGRVAHGFSLVPTPSCALDASTVTEFVLNLTEEIGGENLLINGVSVEYVEGGVGVGIVGGVQNNNGPDVQEDVAAGELIKARLNTSLEVKVSNQLFTVTLIPGGDGDQGGSLFTPDAPFPSEVLYWGGGGQQ